VYAGILSESTTKYSAEEFVTIAIEIITVKSRKYFLISLSPLI
jgi:hypothetical protein